MMAQLKQDSSPDFVRRVQRIEDRSDKCHRDIALLQCPWNLAAWAALTETIRVIETNVPTALYATESQVTVVLNASRIAAQLYRFAKNNSAREVEISGRLEWNRRVSMKAREAFAIAAGYTTCCTVFPFWHAQRYSAELIDADTVRFLSNASAVGRRISAYQKGLRPKHLRENAVKINVVMTREIRGLFAHSLRNAVQISKAGVRFGSLEPIHEALYQSYLDRTARMRRRYPELRIGDYNLEDFRKFYSAVLAIAGAHEHLNYLWAQQHWFPLESAVLIGHRVEWTSLISRLSGLAKDGVRSMLADTTYGRVRSEDFHLLPFAPLNSCGAVLGLAPPFPLASNWEENVLGCLSKRNSDDYSAKSTTKEAEMTGPLVSLTSGARLITGSCELPNPVPDIDLIIEDLDAAILVIAELKWCRKPSGPWQKRERDAEVRKGVHQLERIRGFLQGNPRYLYDRKRATRLLSQYRAVRYCVVARDHLIESPIQDIPIYSYDALLLELTDNQSTQGVFGWLDSLCWHPSEGTDFSVRLERHYAGGVAVESEVYYPPQGPLALLR